MRIRFLIGPLITIPDVIWEIIRVLSGYHMDQSSVITWLVMAAFWSAWSAVTPLFERRALMRERLTGLRRN